MDQDPPYRNPTLWIKIPPTQRYPYNHTKFS